MNREHAFDSIESAHEFVTLVSQVVLDTKRDIEADLQREMRSNASNFSRRVEALQIVAHCLVTLERHMRESRRILNDLRSLRRLLSGERANAGATTISPKSVGAAKTRIAASGPSPRVTPWDAGASAIPRDVTTFVRVKRRALSSGGAAGACNAVSGDTIPWYVRQHTGAAAAMVKSSK